MVAQETPFVDEKPEPPEETTETKVEVEEPVVEVVEVQEASSSMPDWVLYVALGVGNLLLFGLGFFAFKKIMGGPKKDILDELDENAEEEQVEAAKEAPEAAAETEPEPDEEEEPPMEDLDPDSDSGSEIFTEDTPEDEVRADADTQDESEENIESCTALLLREIIKQQIL